MAINAISHMSIQRPKPMIEIETVVEIEIGMMIMTPEEEVAAEEVEAEEEAEESEGKEVAGAEVVEGEILTGEEAAEVEMAPCMDTSSLMMEEN